MEKSNNSSGDVEDYSCEPPNFELKVFAGSPPKRFANLVEQRHSALDSRRWTNKKTNWSLYQPSEVSNAWREF